MTRANTAPRRMPDELVRKLARRLNTDDEKAASILTTISDQEKHAFVTSLLRLCVRADRQLRKETGEKELGT